jgi:hypothetical protein
MSQINRVGTFRGGIVDAGISLTTNGFPQYVVALHAEEYYDEDTKSWVSWQGVDENEITGYLVLFGSKSDNPTTTCKQLQKAIGWDGKSFTSLMNLDVSNIKVQFRIDESTYNEKTSLKVNWIDHYDAQPGRTVKKINEGEIKSLDAIYALGLRKLQGEQQPVKPILAPILPNVPAKLADEKPDLPSPTKGRGRPKKDLGQTVQSPPTAPVKPVAPAVQAKPAKPFTKQDAWDFVVKNKPDYVTDEPLARIWTETIQGIAPGGDEDNLTSELWEQVAQITSTRISEEITF